MNDRTRVILGVVAVVALILLLRWCAELKPDVPTATVVIPPPVPQQVEEPTVSPPPPPLRGMPRNSLPVAEAPPGPTGARLRIVSPRDGAAVTSPVSLKAEVVGVRLAPGGDNDPLAGHLHVLVDTEVGLPNAPITRDAQHVDFGNGEQDGVLDLPPGKHTLFLVLGDGNHVPFSPPVVSPPITVTVTGSNRGPDNSSLTSGDDDY